MRNAVQHQRDTQDTNDRVDLDPGQSAHDTPTSCAGVDLRAVQPMNDTQNVIGGASSCGDHVDTDAHLHRVAAPHDALLGIFADAVNDLENMRKAADSRIEALQRVKQLDERSPEVKRLTALSAGVKALEKVAVRDLQYMMRAHPLGAWVKATKGIGEKQAARLLAAIGDPAERLNPAKLRQYCGHGDPARSRQTKENVSYAVDEDGKRVAILAFSPEAKMRTHLLAERAVVTGVRQLDGLDNSDGYDHAHRVAITPYGQVYLDARAKWADRTNCPTCKDECSNGHKHNHALRLVGKAILLDLWREAQRLRGDQQLPDAQINCVPADLPPTTGVATPNLGSSAADLESAA